MVRGALRNPHAVIIGVLAVLVLGAVALTRIPTDILPVFKTPAVQILTLYPGMPAEVMERTSRAAWSAGRGRPTESRGRSRAR